MHGGVHLGPSHLDHVPCAQLFTYLHTYAKSFFCWELEEKTRAGTLSLHPPPPTTHPHTKRF